MPSVNLVLDPTGPAFPISEDCAMPAIRVTANVVGVTPDPKVPLSYLTAAPPRPSRLLDVAVVGPFPTTRVIAGS